MRRLRRPSAARWLWLFAAALLLRAAMPLLADAAAQAQGRPIGEICSVHGVSLPADRPGAPADPTAAHAGGEHCALGSLALLGPGAPPPGLAPAMPRQDADLPAVRSRPAPPDAATVWVARRKHGPPRTS